MLVVETIAKIRRAFFVQGKSIKAICRELRVSRKVVRKVLRSGVTEFSYERAVQPLPRIGPWKADLDRLLVSNEAKAARERLTLIRVFEELRGLGYGGGYDAVRRYARSWQRERSASTADAYGIIRQMRISRGRFHVGMAKEDADHRQSVALRKPRARIRMPEIVEAKVRETGR